MAFLDVTGDAEKTAQLLGHSDRRMLDARYGHLGRRHAAGLKAVEERFAAAASGPDAHIQSVSNSVSPQNVVRFEDLKRRESQRNPSG